jgi:hypothetical protein
MQKNRRNKAEYTDYNPTIDSTESSAADGIMG